MKRARPNKRLAFWLKSWVAAAQCNVIRHSWPISDFVTRVSYFERPHPTVYLPISAIKDTIIVTFQNKNKKYYKPCSVLASNKTPKLFICYLNKPSYFIILLVPETTCSSLCFSVWKPEVETFVRPLTTPTRVFSFQTKIEKTRENRETSILNFILSKCSTMPGLGDELNSR